jgi:hypothetical protein
LGEAFGEDFEVVDLSGPALVPLAVGELDPAPAPADDGAFEYDANLWNVHARRAVLDDRFGPWRPYDRYPPAA